MGNCDDENTGAIKSIKHGIGKSMNRASPQFSPNHTRPAWKLLDSDKSLLDFGQQSSAQAGLSGFVVQRGRFEFLLCFDKNSNDAHFNLCRISEMTS